MEIINRVLKGDIRAAARLMSMVEEGHPGTKALLNALRPQTGQAHRIGITGSPGTGKSTLIDRLIEEFRIQRKKVGTVVVDVSSPLTSGAILGDRIRMNRHVIDKAVFIRSMASRGHLGGLSKKTLQIIMILEAMSKDVILVETVGVGQSEVEVARLVHTTIVVTSPGLGDDIQTMKAGLFEVGHLFVLNKSDLPGAEEARKFLQDSIALNFGKKDWLPPIYITNALKGEGVRELVRGINTHRHLLIQAR
jgi:LAO/AO transport system kinase